ncbi:MAG: hypothetical protein ABIJ56_06850 [Pseudomonadota bacterium]
MTYFHFGRRLQLLLIAGALAASPGCYTSSGGTSDVGGDDTTVTDSSDTAHEEEAGNDVPDVAEDPVEEDIEEDEWIVVDPLPGPQCDTLPTMQITATKEEGGAHYIVVSVVIDTWEWLTCEPREVCLDAVRTGGAGEISAVEQVDYRTARFRFDYESELWEGVPIELTWHLLCYDYADEYQETVQKVVYICTDEMGQFKVTDTIDECPSVVDCLPWPMAGVPGKAGVTMAGAAMKDGGVRISLQGLSGNVRKVKWEASHGELRVLSPDTALFTPAPGAGVQVVQAAMQTDHGVIIECYRHKKT